MAVLSPIASAAADVAPRVERATTPRDLFRQYLAETGHADDDRLVALFDELHDSETV